ncbi:CYTH domain-containing protein [Mediterraneibacter gnavus]|uniref:CYTH domain-containing protein n=1 Tax=Mediterraneibacter gnavus TaxID=33038 RepID=UPI001FA8909E|nr:CYTH domain-containing protein [Mediterraneibacter gnavus]
MEIERKYLISSVPFALSSYPCRKIEQGYLSTAPVVRIRRDNNDYILTYKSKGMMIREEYNLPLTKESYEHLKEKIDGRLITKKRYVIPLKDSLFIELDIFSGDLAPLMLAEVEFPDKETANHFTPPKWKLKCSQFPSCVDFTGFNCIQNCVYCYYLSFFSKIALKHRPHYFHI